MCDQETDYNLESHGVSPWIGELQFLPPCPRHSQAQSSMTSDSPGSQTTLTSPPHLLSLKPHQQQPQAAGFGQNSRKALLCVLI